MKRSDNLPGNWTDLSNGITRYQAENILQFPEVTVYLDGKPAAVLLSIENYQRLTRTPDLDPPKEFPA